MRASPDNNKLTLIADTALEIKVLGGQEHELDFTQSVITDAWGVPIAVPTCWQDNVLEALINEDCYTYDGSGFMLSEFDNGVLLVKAATKHSCGCAAFITKLKTHTLAFYERLNNNV